MKSRKVFGIGFHKTGTTSLAEALKILGYSVTGPDGVHDPHIADRMEEMVFDLAEEHDAFQDNPWPLFYRKLDERYPGSKFILTLRPADKWINSLVRHFGTKTTPMRKWIYGEAFGCPEGNEQVYLDRYEKHNREVMEYFGNRPDDLLVFRLTEGDGWEKMCRFLDEPVPDAPFPHKNSIREREAQPRAPGSVFGRFISKITGQ